MCSSRLEYLFVSLFSNIQMFLLIRSHRVDHQGGGASALQGAELHLSTCCCCFHPADRFSQTLVYFINIKSMIEQLLCPHPLPPSLPPLPRSLATRFLLHWFYVHRSLIPVLHFRIWPWQPSARLPTDNLNNALGAIRVLGLELIEDELRPHLNTVLINIKERSESITLSHSSAL